MVKTLCFHLRAQVQSLVREPRFCMPRGAARKKKRGGVELTKGAWIRGSINAANRGDSTELAHRAWHGIGVQLIVTFLSFLDAWDAYYGMCLQAL